MTGSGESDWRGDLQGREQDCVESGDVLGGDARVEECNDGYWCELAGDSDEIRGKREEMKDQPGISLELKRLQTQTPPARQYVRLS